MKEDSMIEKGKKSRNSDIETIIKVDNLSCEGCAHTIEKALLAMDHVEKVDVLLEKEEVKIRHKADANLFEVKEKLNELGYPEKGTTHGLEKISRNLKSYVSCAIGRLDSKK